MATRLQLLALVLTVALAAVVESETSGTVTFPSGDSEKTGNVSINFIESRTFSFKGNGSSEERGVREGKNFLDWIGLGTGNDVDPYLAKANALCLEGDLPECFKSRALLSLDEFFDKGIYLLTENARVVRMPETTLRDLSREPYEFSETPRANEPEWDQFVKFLMRKVERFVKSTAIEVAFPNEVTEQGRYSPRFIDEIASEIDILEDKTDSKFSRKRLKKLFIPLLVILKLFKLKLLLFLPLVLGLASFKKLLGFLALVIPGLIGFFKLCKPNLHHNYGLHGHSSYYNQPPPHILHQYSPSVGHRYASDSPYYGSPYNRELNPSSSSIDSHYSPASDASGPSASSNVAFRDEPDRSSYDAHNIAYNAYQHYGKS